MATASNPDTANPMLDDVIRRGIKRTLPCKLTDDEFMGIAKMRVDKEALLEQLQLDLAREQKKRKDQIAELQDEITKMGKELHTGEQDRTVPCNEVFRRADDGTGWVHVIRMDTYDGIERRPATPLETQRYLPSFEGGSSGALLDQALEAQGKPASSAADDADAEVDALEDDEAGDDGPDADDDDSEDETPAKPSGKARKARRGGKAK